MVILSILTDIFCTKSPKINFTNHHYTPNKSFEQSLDIYYPDISQQHNNKPIVALVVGSAWVGHRSFLYAQTSWWNSSGPKTVARLGYICVCIRHRGSFPKIYSPLTALFVAVNVGMVKLLIDRILLWFYGLCVTDLLHELDIGEATAIFIAFATGMLAMDLARNGSASFDEMQTDVMDALAWFEEHRDKLINQSAISTSRNKIVFGGYSSGGHVAAMVMQQPHLWRERSLPDPEEFCSKILYISPVVCTKPYHVDLERHLSSLSLNKMPTPSLSSESSATSAPEVGISPLSSKHMTTSSLPSWLTNHLIATVFGHEIPSPIHNYSNSPNLPHIFIGCNNEMFGLNWLDLFFASRDYNELLQGKGVDSKYIGVDSDHWNILGSWDLLLVLERELRRITT